jgi:hypothetical protein
LKLFDRGNETNMHTLRFFTCQAVGTCRRSGGVFLAVSV